MLAGVGGGGAFGSGCSILLLLFVGWLFVRFFSFFFSFRRAVMAKERGVGGDDDDNHNDI